MRLHRGWAVFIVLGVVAAAIGCSDSGKPDADPAYLAEIETWRTQRIEGLKKPDGWLSLVGLHWLSEGPNRFGSDSSNTVVFPRDKAPRFMGTIVVEDTVVRVDVAPGAEVLHEGARVSSMILHHDQDRDYGATVLTHGPLSWHVIKRGERFAVRVKDSESPVLLGFEGIDSYPVDPSWRIEARLESHDPPRTLEITNMLGDVDREPSPGTLVFTVGGRTHRLEPIAAPGDEKLFIVFADATSGKQTYGGGRFLGADRPGPDGTVILDFNKAYNPPCVFTPYATCPLPPEQNRLAIAVEAGERAYKKPGH